MSLGHLQGAAPVPGVLEMAALQGYVSEGWREEETERDWEPSVFGNGCMLRKEMDLVNGI